VFTSSVQLQYDRWYTVTLTVKVRTDTFISFVKLFCSIRPLKILTCVWILVSGSSERFSALGNWEYSRKMRWLSKKRTVVWWHNRLWGGKVPKGRHNHTDALGHTAFDRELLNVDSLSPF